MPFGYPDREPRSRSTGAQRRPTQAARDLDSGIRRGFMPMWVQGPLLRHWASGVKSELGIGLRYQCGFDRLQCFKARVDLCVIDITL